MRVLAAVVHARHGPFRVEPLEIEAPRLDEVLVRVVAAGICHTDLLFRGSFPWTRPMVLGHEGAGIVEAVGPLVTHLQPGDAVVLTFASCGQCIRCRQGQPAYCDHFRRLNFAGARPDGSSALSRDGVPVNGHFFGQSSFATHALATHRNAIKVPRDVPLELLGPLGCGVQTGAGAVFNSLRVRAGSRMAIFGVGAVGLSAVMAARLAGCTTIVAVDIKPIRLHLARELGATHAIDAAAGDASQGVRAITGGGADFTLETTGVPDVLGQALTSLAPLGVCGMIGAAPPETQAVLPWRELLFGRTIRGIVEGDSLPDQFILTLLELYRQGRFPIDRLVRFYPLAEINDAVRDSLAGETVKPVLRMEP